MYIKQAEIKTPNGLLPQSASKFVHTALKYQSEIYIINEDEQINAKSILGLLASTFHFGTKIDLRAEGPDEKEAVNTLCGIIENYTYS